MGDGRTAGRLVRHTVIVAVGLAAGAGAVLAFRGGSGGPVRATHPPSVSRFDFTDGALDPVIASEASEAVRPPTAEPASPEAALGMFLDAVSRGDPQSSYSLLDASGRRRFPTRASWARGQADLAVPTSFEIGASRRAFGLGGDVVEVEVASAHRPSLDAVRGLVPGRSQALWQIRQEDGHWRVGAEPVSFRPLLPPDAAASDMVRGWLARLQGCDRAGATSLQAGPYLYGPASLAQAPCEQQGSWSVGSPTGLDKAPDATDFVAAFGPEVSDWTRAVPVDGPGSRFFAVVAPMGDAWAVVGVAVRS